MESTSKYFDMIFFIIPDNVQKELISNLSQNVTLNYFTAFENAIKLKVKILHLGLQSTLEYKVL